MASYGARVQWQRSRDEIYTDNRYSRGHEWQFDGGITVPASASPHVVPLPLSVAEHVDPEEAFIASLSSCHMLFFLSIAAKQRFVVDRYTDEPVGIMRPGSDGRVAMVRVTLRPRVVFSGEYQPSPARLEQMHQQAHQQCFIANSVKTELVTEIVH